MKATQLLIRTLLITSMFFDSCKKDEYGPSILSIDQAEYPIGLCTLRNYGSVTPSSYNSDLRLFTEGIEYSDGQYTGAGLYIYIELYSASAYGPITGTYYLDRSDARPPFSYDQAIYFSLANMNTNSANPHPIDSGSVYIELLTGGEYYIKFSFQTHDGIEVKGQYNGRPTVISVN